jgi:purine-nucleoside phosphorylase
MGHDQLAVAEADLARIREARAGTVDVALVLGSGLGGIAEAVSEPVEVPFSELPGMPSPRASVAGHAGRLILGTLGGSPIAVFQGRLHRYQGLSALEAAYPARLAAALGARTLIVTNAAGGLTPILAPGSLALITDHINLMGDDPLVGWPGPEGGTPFVPMAGAYDPELRALARESATALGIRLAEGVYAGVPGPSYETSAETEMLRRVGADLVGMSTVPEVIAARALGLRVLGISLVTNVAGAPGLSHAEVLEAGSRAGADLARLLPGIIDRL